jgi:hypothetical protein
MSDEKCRCLEIDSTWAPQSVGHIKGCPAGRLSIEFWERVNTIPWNEEGQTIYNMGCALQDLESRVVTLLNNAENKRRDSGKQAKGE